jgi:hypothetical protein
MKLWVALVLLALSSSVAGLQSAPKEKVYLELGNTKITENGKSVIEVGGKCGGGQVLAFHLPQKGVVRFFGRLIPRLRFPEDRKATGQQGHLRDG